MPHPVADMLGDAAEHCRTEDHREGNVLRFDAGERIIVSGDIHGNRPNLVKIIKHAALGADPRRMLVLQELIHGGPTDAQGGDRSFEVLLRAVRLKQQYPAQVHFILANHDVSELTGNEISKDGCGACKALRTGLVNAYGEDADEIHRAMCTFLASLPLVARCPNGVLISHSLPSPGREACFDPAILSRPYQDEDFRRGGSIYELLWGRRHTPEALDALVSRLEAGIFINGHQPQDNGYLLNGRQLILASEHPHGTIAEFDAGEELDLDLLDTIVRPVVRL
ncbi:MAG: metallophosphoesterase [Planctomycetota bacterium]